MRRLRLHRETLTALADDDLALVAGAVLPTTPPGVCAGDLITKTEPLVSRVYECVSIYTPCVTSTCER